MPSTMTKQRLSTPRTPCTYVRTSSSTYSGNLKPRLCSLKAVFWCALFCVRVARVVVFVVFLQGAEERANAGPRRTLRGVIKDAPIALDENSDLRYREVIKRLKKLLDSERQSIKELRERHAKVRACCRPLGESVSCLPARLPACLPACLPAYLSTCVACRSVVNRRSERACHPS